MNEWEEISFDKIDGKGLFKFTYFVNGEGNGEDPWVECIENDNEDDIFAQDLLIKLQNRKNLTDLRAWMSVVEYD